MPFLRLLQFAVVAAVLSSPVVEATEFRILLDADDDSATGCTVASMGGVDAVLTTVVETTSTGETVTHTFGQVCEAGMLSAQLALANGWDAGFEAESGQLLVETSIPYASLGVSPPSVMRVGVVGQHGSSTHGVFAQPDGSPGIVSRSGRRRAVVAPGLGREILLDGKGSDWSGLPALFDESTSPGGMGFRLARVFAFADSASKRLFFRIDANLSKDKPFARNDAYERAPGESVTVEAPGVLQNDRDVNGLPLTATPVTPAAHGTVTLNPDGSFTYTPDDLSSQQNDAFEYKASNGAQQSNAARVRISVTTPDTELTAVDDAYDANEDEILNVVPSQGVLGNDAGGAGALTVALLAPPARGTVVLNLDGSFAYTPAADQSGDDSFTYTVSDGTDSDTATVTIHVAAVNDAPAISNETYSIVESSAAGTVAGNVAVVDVDAGDAHSYAITAGNESGAFTINGSGAITVASAVPLVFGTHPQFILTVGVTDNGVPPLSAAATVTINLIQVDRAPVAVDGVETVPEDGALNIPAPGVLAGASDPNGDSLSVVLETGPTHGALTLHADGSWTYAPAANFNGTDTFSYRATDGTNESNVATMTITVESVNDVPVAVEDQFNLLEGGRAEDTVLANDFDVEGYANRGPFDPPSVSVVLDAGVVNGTLSLNGGNFQYTHDGSENLFDSFTYHLNDGEADSNTVTVIFSVIPVDDPSVNHIPGPQTTMEDVPLDLSISITDVDSPELQIVLVATKGVITLASTDGLQFISSDGISDQAMNFGGTLDAINAALATISFRPDADYFGPANIRVSSYDLDRSRGTIPSDDIPILVTAVNDLPIARPDVYNVLEGGGIDERVTENDSDVEGPLTAVLDTNVSHGTLIFHGSWAPGDGPWAAGSFTYTHDGSESTTDSFSYHVNDGSADSATVTVSISVMPMNDSPANHIPGAQTTSKNVTLVFSEALGRGISVSDADAYGEEEVTLTATNGAITLDSIDGLLFSVGDGTGDTNTTFRGTIEALNAAMNVVSFQPTLDYSGPANLRITTNDLWELTPGGVTTSDIQITVVP